VKISQKWFRIVVITVEDLWAPAPDLKVTSKARTSENAACINVLARMCLHTNWKVCVADNGNWWVEMSKYWRWEVVTCTARVVVSGKQHKIELLLLLTEFCQVQNSLYVPSVAFSYIGSITARHSSSGRQPNFVVWYKEWTYGTFAQGATYIWLCGHHVGHPPTF